MLTQLERPLDYVTLHDICVQDEFVNQFDFVEEFYELLDIKALEMKTDENGEELVRLTRKGRETAETMKDRILPEILDHAVRSALQLISFKARGLTARSSIEDVGGGKFRLTCIVEGAGGAHLETKLVLESRRQAERMRINFDERSEFIYRGIMALLSGNMNYLAESWSDDLAAADED
ncbi:MAG: DUF4364 family protein [Clostridia bacterium]|nr:DUF4364 family protein [Clostridia bacterium]